MPVKRWMLPFVWSLLVICGVLLSGCAGGGGPVAYTFHDLYISADYLIQEHQNSGDCEDIYLNEDGSLTLVLTEGQRRQWADPGQTEALLFPLKLMGVSAAYADGYTRLTVSAPEEVAEGASPMLLHLAWQAELYQVLNGTEEWSLEVTVLNSDTGETVQSAVLPEEDLDWSFAGM